MTTESEGWQKASNLSRDVGWLEAVLEASGDAMEKLIADAGYDKLSEDTRARIDAIRKAMASYWEGMHT